MYLITISTFTSIISRYINKIIYNTNTNIIKIIILISSGLLGLTTLINWKDIGIEYSTDSISDILIILTVFLLPLSIISNWNNIKNNLYYELIFNLGIILLLNFICQDMLSFYIYFELSLIPLFIIINLYGANNREKAADYILIYTLLSSLFMLISICLYQIICNNTEFKFINLIVLSLDLQSLLFIGIIIGIAVKTPIFPFHTWLPVVHSESPLAGSILLAGIILKLAIYAIIRLILPTLSDASLLFSPFLYILSLITIIYTSLITLKQTDLKVIIAYSSISHMAVCIMGILSNSFIGINGSLILSIAHGLVSPALFIIVGGILYDRYHNRLIYYFQGLITYMPLLSFYLIILSFCNIGAPLSLNFIGELFSITGSFNRSPIITSIATLSVLLSASYQMKITNRLTGGIKLNFINNVSDLTYREHFLLLILTLPTIFFGIFPNSLLLILNYSHSLLYIL